MHVELIGMLICPRAHEATPLLAAVDRLDGRSIVVGTLACPVCDTRYPILDGVVVFDPVRRIAEQARAPGRGLGSDDVMRVAAMLDLTEPGGFVLVGGAWAVVAEPLAEATGVGVVVLNPPGSLSEQGMVSPIYASGSLPIGRGALRGAVLDADRAVPAAVIATAVRPHGRLAAPVTVGVPDGVRELARDAELWVAERVPDRPGDETPAIIALRRADVGQSLG